MYHPTIEELVDLWHPDYVSVNNPVEKEKWTPSDTPVMSVKVDFDDADGIMMYVTI